MPFFVEIFSQIDFWWNLKKENKAKQLIVEICNKANFDGNFPAKKIIGETFPTKFNFGNFSTKLSFVEMF